LKEMLRENTAEDNIMQQSAGPDAPPGVKMAGDEHSTVFRVRSYDELLYVLQSAWSSGGKVRIYVRDADLGIWLLCSEPVEENGTIVCKDNPSIKFTELGTTYPMAYVIVKRDVGKSRHKVMPRANLLRKIMEKEMRVSRKGEEKKETRAVIMVPEFAELAKADLSLSGEVSIERIRVRRKRRQAKR